METGIIIAALVILGLGVAFTLSALWAIRATIDRDRTLAQEIARVASNHASQIGGLRSTAQGLTATIEVLRRDLNAVQEDARAAKLEAYKPVPVGGPAPAGRASVSPPPFTLHLVRPADPDGDETAFIERPPANDGATTTAGPITPTKLSPAPAPRDPKA